MRRSESRQLHRATGWLLLLALVGLTACGEKANTRAPDIEASVGSIEMRDIKLDTPPDGVYEVGSAVRLEFAIVNTGRQTDTLIGVSGPGFTDVVIDGAPRTPPLEIPIAPGETVFSGAPDEPVLILTGLTETLRTVDVTPVTFTFAEAGETTVDVVVSSPLRLTIDRYLRQQEDMGN